MEVVDLVGGAAEFDENPDRKNDERENEVNQ